MDKLAFLAPALVCDSIQCVYVCVIMNRTLLAFPVIVLSTSVRCISLFFAFSQVSENELNKASLATVPGPSSELCRCPSSVSCGHSDY